jgi:16S rRNA (cytosine967-C5)-methyltransferase
MALYSRPAAAKAVVEVLVKRRSLSSVQADFEPMLEAKDKPMWQELTYGTLRFHLALELVAHKLLKKRFKTKDLDLQFLLEVGLYQLIYMRVEPFVAINETVNGAKSLDKEWACGLINACLRNFERTRDAMLKKLGGHPQFQTAMPNWILTHIKDAYPQDWKSIVAATNDSAPMFLRVNQKSFLDSDSNTGRDDYLEELSDCDIAATACEFSQQGIQLTQAVNVNTLPGFSDGSCSVQDEAAQLAAQFLDLSDGEKVLDACAAPGGKTCHLLESADVSVTALELDESRISRIYENLERLKLDAEVICTDASAVADWWDDKAFDSILLDVPCSAMGVIRRHPDIKFLRKPDDINELVKIQANMLDSICTTLKSGGKLLYATCSILPCENDEQIKAFLARNNGFSLEKIYCDGAIDTGFGLQFLPKINGHDGFFYCLLKKS